MKFNAKITLALLIVGTLVGCTTYSDTLGQKLVGKTADEKRSILAQECGTEISQSLKKNDPANVQHSEKMKQVCEEMTGKTVNISKPEIQPSK